MALGVGAPIGLGDRRDLVTHALGVEAQRELDELGVELHRSASLDQVRIHMQRKKNAPP